MIVRRLAAGTLVALVALLGAGEGAWAEEPHAALIEAHAESVVSVKYVLNVRMTFQGQSMDREVSGSTMGVVVDPLGLVMVPSGALAPHMGTNIEVSSTPTSIRVVFPGDPTEYDAVLGATDSRLGLGFLRIKDLQERTAPALDLTGEAEPALGERLYGVSRLGQGFDHAPYCDTADVVAWVTKPRKMWLIQGRFTEVAHPLFTAEGVLTGFVVRQQGVGDQGRLPFLLPVGVARSTIERAGREAERVLEEALEREAEEEAALEEEAATAEEEPDEPPPGE